MSFIDHYEILSIHRLAVNEEIRSARRKLVLQLHPDKNDKDSQAQYTERFLLIQEAYEVLSNPSRKAEFDCQMNLHFGPPATAQAQKPKSDVAVPTQGSHEDEGTIFTDMTQDTPTATSDTFIQLQGHLPDGSLDPYPSFQCHSQVVENFIPIDRFLVPDEDGIPIPTWNVPYPADVIRILADVLTRNRAHVIIHYFWLPKGTRFPYPMTKETFRKFRWLYDEKPTLEQKLAVLAALHTIEADTTLQYQLIWDDIHLQVHNSAFVSEELCNWVRSAFPPRGYIVRAFELRRPQQSH